MSGCFITFEGIEKSGKTTQAALLRDRLQQDGYDVVLTREPGGTPIAEKVRGLILDSEHTDMSPYTELLLFEASRAQHVQELIRPSLADGKIVICDRFTDSTLAYQGYGRRIALDTIQQLNRIAVSGCEPDLTFFLDIPLQLWLERRANSSGLPDRLESEATVSYGKAGKADADQRADQPQLSIFEMGFHEKVREGYVKLAEQYPQRIHTIDGTKPTRRVAREVYEVVVDRLAALDLARKGD